jgi:hypothetical protein
VTYPGCGLPVQTFPRPGKGWKGGEKANKVGVEIAMHFTTLRLRILYEEKES